MTVAPHHRYLWIFVFALLFSACSKDRKAGFLLQGSEWDVYSLTIADQETIGPGFTKVTLMFDFYDVKENKGNFHAFFSTPSENTSFSSKYTVEHDGTLLRLIYSNGSEEEYVLRVENTELKMEIDIPAGHVIYRASRQ